MVKPIALHLPTSFHPLNSYNDEKLVLVLQGAALTHWWLVSMNPEENIEGLLPGQCSVQAFCWASLKRVHPTRPANNNYFYSRLISWIFFFWIIHDYFLHFLHLLWTFVSPISPSLNLHTCVILNLCLCVYTLNPTPCCFRSKSVNISSVELVEVLVLLSDL